MKILFVGWDGVGLIAFSISLSRLDLRYSRGAREEFRENSHIGELRKRDSSRSLICKHLILISTKMRVTEGCVQEFSNKGERQRSSVS